ncbi:MAG: hypothetical protein H6824_20305 [Planctomycetaceae bacterium]|nr:hypothetical protein [Planctomycetaceae bacterium]
MVEAIDLARKTHNLHLWSYVIMPEHVHLLFWPTTAEDSISAILTMDFGRQTICRKACPRISDAYGRPAAKWAHQLSLLAARWRF